MSEGKQINSIFNMAKKNKKKTKNIRDGHLQLVISLSKEIEHECPKPSKFYLADLI